MPSRLRSASYLDANPSAYPANADPLALANPAVEALATAAMGSVSSPRSPLKKSVCACTGAAYELTFCPSNVTSFTPCSLNKRTSYKIDAKSRERSRPRVYGTMQNAHALSHPRIIVTNALCDPASRTGIISAYVSSTLNCTFIAFSPVPTTASIKLGKSRYASGPATISANRSASSNFSFTRSAIHPKTPTTGFSIFFLPFPSDRKYANRCQIFASALSRIAHVLIKITFAPFTSSVASYPASFNTDIITSLSFTFI